MGKVVPFYIHINQWIIKKNKNLPPDAQHPPITIKKGKHRKVDEAFEIEIIGDSKLEYNPHEPILSCGARLVLICNDYKKIK